MASMNQQRKSRQALLASVAILALLLLSGRPSAAPFVTAPSQGGIADALAGQFTTLIDAQATPEARGLMRYLSAIYGSYTLAGEQMSYNGPWSGANDRWSYELGKIRTWTGKGPAIRGYDFMDVINSWGSPVMDYARTWAKDSGGIVTLCWHWRQNGGDFNKGGYTLPNDPTTDAKIHGDIEKLAVELKKFQAARIPVLFRPLHEAPGAWFWWGNSGSAPFKKLWKMMHDILVTENGIHNLIWVMSYDDGHSGNADWYPGNSLVDIIGVDGYSAQWQNLWDPLWGVTGQMTKMIAMSENKSIPGWNASRSWLYSTTWNNEIFDALGQNDFTGYYAQAQTLSLADLPTYMSHATWDQLLPHALSSSSTALSSAARSSSRASSQVLAMSSSVTPSSCSSLLASSSSSRLASSSSSVPTARLMQAQSSRVGLLREHVYDLLGRVSEWAPSVPGRR